MYFLRSLSVLVLIFFFTTAEAQHCRSKKILTAAQQIATMDPHFELGLSELELFPHSSVVTGYEYLVEPAYTNGLYSRTDSWFVGLKGNRSTNLSASNRSTFNVGAKSKTQATFIRFFNDPCKAMLAKPYSPKRIPLKAQKALGSEFAIGDYFLFRGELGIVAGADILKMLGSSFWGVSVSASYLMEGNYQVHIVKIDKNHIRLKVIGHRGNTLSTSVGLGYENEFNIFSIEQLNDRLEKIVNIKPIKVSTSASHAKIFMVDYVLDLTDPEVATAYEELLPQIKNFKNINLIEEFKKGIESNLLLDLSKLEEIYRRDYQDGRSDRLKRNLRSTSDQNTWAFGLDIGNSVIGFELNRGRSSANMTIPRANDFLDRYVLKTWEKKSESRYFHSWSKSKNHEGIRTLLKADENFKNFEPINIVKFIYTKKNQFTYKHFKELQVRLQKSLPVEIYQQIPWNQWSQRPGQKLMNYGLRYEFLIAPEVILNAPELSISEIKTLFTDHIMSKGLTPSDYFATSGYEGETSSEEQFESSLYFMAKTLSRALNRSLPILKRIELIADLKKNTLFAASGLSFMTAIVPDKMQHYCHLDLNISSDKSIIDFSYGDPALSTLYKKILTIKAALDDEGIDLIREAESLSSI